MAASGYTPLYIYASGTPGSTPSAGNLTNTSSGSEIAINYADGKIYYKNSSNVVTAFSSTANVPNALTINNLGSGATSGTTFNGSAAVTISYNTVGASPLAGSTSIVTVGTISTGTWQGTAIGASYVSTLNQNTTGSAGSVSNALTSGTGLTFSSGTTYNGSAAITVNSTGSAINTQSSAYTLVASDAGKSISISSGGVTVPASVMTAGNIVTIYNNSGSSQTITQGTSLTMQWAGQSSSQTGNRTLGLYGICTVIFISSTSCVISGAGLT